jgi:hypothetical protein
MSTTRDTSADQKILIRHTFEREGAEANTPVIEVVYEVGFPETARLASDIKVLRLLSVTRIDTREPVNLTPEENKRVNEAITEFAAGMTEDW